MFRSPRERNEALGDVSIFKNKLKSLRFAYVSIKSLVRKRKRKKERKKERKKADHNKKKGIEFAE